MARRIAAVLTLALGIGAVIPSIAQTDPWVGTWELNAAKSTYSVGAVPKSETVRIEAVPNGIKAVMDAVNAQGARSVREITAGFDGKEYELKGAPIPTTWALTRIDAHTFELVSRINGKVVATTRVVVSSDGRTRTNTTTGTTPLGQPIKNVAVFERQ
jgi:hypothetical protein